MRPKYSTWLMCNDDGDSLLLEQSPIGWDDVKFNLIRDLTYLGIMKSISIEYQFVGDGFRFLQSKRLKYGMDVDIMIRQYINNPNTWLFDGKLNQENFVEDRNERKYRVDIVQSSFIQNFQNREDVQINVLNDISLDRKSVTPAALQDCLFRGRQIEFFTEFDGSVSSSPEIYSHTLPFLIKVNGNSGVNTSSYTIVLVVTPEELQEQLYAPGTEIYTNNLLTDQVIEVDFSANISIVYLGEPIPIFIFSIGDLTIRYGYRHVYKIVDIDPDDNRVVLYSHSIDNGDGNYTFSFLDSITVEPGHRIVFACEKHTLWYSYDDGDLTSVVDVGNIDDTGDPGDLNGTRMRSELTYNELYLTLTTNSEVPDSTHPVILPHELFSNIIAQINGGTLYSDVFGRIDLGYYQDGEFAYLGITKGELLRGIPPSEVQIPTSMRDAFKSYSSVICLGAIITDTQIRIDPLDILFNQNISVNLGEVSKLTINPSKEFLFNSVKAGYPKNEYEQENGRDEFNTEYQYTNSFKSVKKELDLKSVYYGDGYGIEFARRAGIINTGTADSRYDDQIFFVDMIKVDGVLITRRLEDILHVEGIFSPETALNVRIAVGQNMLRHRKYLTIPLHRKDKKLFFQSKDKNASLELVTALGVTDDGEDIELGDTSYFLPHQPRFQCPITIGKLFEILANPLGIIQYSYKKEDFFDFLMEADSEIDKASTEWRTLGTRDTPVEIEDIATGDLLMHDDGIDDFVQHDSLDDDLILWQ